MYQTVRICFRNTSSYVSCEAVFVIVRIRDSSQILFDENFSVTQVNALDFDLTHSETGPDGVKHKRVMHLSDLMGDSVRWVKSIQE